MSIQGQWREAFWEVRQWWKGNNGQQICFIHKLCIISTCPSDWLIPGMLRCMPELCTSRNMRLPYSTYISRVFNFANFTNLELFVKFIHLKFEPLHCHTYGQHEFAKFFNKFLQSSYLRKFRPAKYKRYNPCGWKYLFCHRIRDTYHWEIGKYLYNSPLHTNLQFVTTDTHT